MSTEAISDTFIPVAPPEGEASGGSTSMTETIRMALEDAKNTPDEDELPVPEPKAEKPKDEPKPVEAKPDDKPEEKPEAKEKARTEDGKFKSAATDEQADDKAPKAEGDASTDDDRGRTKIKPPERLLPDARDLWVNVPRSVQRDVDNIVRDYESKIETFRQSTERYEAIRVFDDLAKENGRDLRDSLIKINQIENSLKANPIAGLNEILREIGPRKADGSTLTLYEVANHIVNQGPQGYQQTIAQANQQQQAQQRNSEVEQLRQENEALKAGRVVGDIDANVVAPFREAHPRFNELHDDIVFFLKSGKVPEGLSHIDRLDAAYAMAERLNPSSGSSGQGGHSALDQSDRVELDSSGRKSIRSSPGAVSHTESSVDPKDMQSIIRSALRGAVR